MTRDWKRDQHVQPGTRVEPSTRETKCNPRGKRGRARGGGEGGNTMEGERE